VKPLKYIDQDQSHMKNIRIDKVYFNNLFT